MFRLLALLGIASANANAARIANSTENLLFLEQHSVEALGQKIEQERKARRNSKIIFWAIIFGCLFVLSRHGHSQTPADLPFRFFGVTPPWYTQYNATARDYYAPKPVDPCAGLPVAPVGVDDPWHRCQRQVSQNQAYATMQQHNAELHQQWQWAEDNHVCNGYNPSGCIAPSQRQPRMSEAYVMEHMDQLQYQSCLGGSSLACQWVEHRMPHQ